MVLHGIAWYCMVLHGIAWYFMVLHGIALNCIALHGIAGYCMVLHGIACMVLYSIAPFTRLEPALCALFGHWPSNFATFGEAFGGASMG